MRRHHCVRRQGPSAGAEGAWDMDTPHLGACLPTFDRDDNTYPACPTGCGYESKWSVNVKLLGK